MPEHIVREYVPGDEVGIAHLQRHLWGTADALNRRYFAWKYTENPYIADPLVYVATVDGRVVGMRGVYGASWELPGGGSTVGVPCAADLVIDPDHRDKGLYRELNHVAEAELTGRGYHRVFNLSANPENFVAATLALGWKSVGSLEILVRRSATGNRAAALLPRVVDSPRLYALARRGLQLGRRLREALGVDVFKKLDRSAMRTGGPVQVLSSPPIHQMAALVASLGPSTGIRHVRDERYLAWRYRNPRARYRFLTWGERDLDGYLVLQNIPGRHRVAIVDWEARDPEVRQQLVRFVADESSLGSVRIWSATLPDSSRTALEALDFRDAYSESMLRYAGRLLIKLLPGAGSRSDPVGELDLSQMGSWDLRMIYSDAL